MAHWIHLYLYWMLYSACKTSQILLLPCIIAAITNGSLTAFSSLSWSSKDKKCTLSCNSETGSVYSCPLTLETPSLHITKMCSRTFNTFSNQVVWRLMLSRTEHSLAWFVLKLNKLIIPIWMRSSNYCKLFSDCSDTDRKCLDSRAHFLSSWSCTSVHQNIFSASRMAKVFPAGLIRLYFHAVSLSFCFHFIFLVSSSHHFLHWALLIKIPWRITSSWHGAQNMIRFDSTDLHALTSHLILLSRPLWFTCRPSEQMQNHNFFLV